MTMTPRPDDFQTRRTHLRAMSDDDLQAYFWRLVDQIVHPLVEEAHTHTTPSIERSVLLRMGFSSLEAKPLVTLLTDKGLLQHGAGHLILQLARRKGLTVREAGMGLLQGKYWEELPG